ncbi:MAG TPA: hypothetical protein VME46_23300 [Acidimicrobiales bacterium]|nr:hypothetical protein [Acidimicrobiales bacterium]
MRYLAGTAAAVRAAGGGTGERGRRREAGSAAGTGERGRGPLPGTGRKAARAPQGVNDPYWVQERISSR